MPAKPPTFLIKAEATAGIRFLQAAALAESRTKPAPINISFLLFFYHNNAVFLSVPPPLRKDMQSYVN